MSKKNFYSKKQNNARYKLHWKVRKAGFRLVTKLRTVYHKHDKERGKCRALDRLEREFGYVVQLEI